MNRIVIVIPYFGSFRKDFQFWLSSVAYNHSIDFLLFTDQTVNDAPANLTVIPFTLRRIESVIQEKIDSSISLTSPYKLCDFKPTYGHIFEEYLEGYDFWGHCDNDLIFGDIRHFLTDDILRDYDRILVRGHLTLYRNSDEINHIYQKVEQPNCYEVFNSPKIFAFDEWGGTTRYWYSHLSDKLFDELLFDDILQTHYEFISAQKLKVEKKVKRVIFAFDRGKLFRYYLKGNKLHREETLYAHFQKRTLDICTQSYDKFVIVPNKYVDWDNNLDVSYLIRSTPNPLYCKMQFYILKIKRALKKVKITLCY